MGRFAVRGARLYDGKRWHEDSVLLVADGWVEGIVPGAFEEPDLDVIGLRGGLIAPGFVDLQVNGGGGVLFNAAPSADTIATIGAAHAPYGTAAFFPTLISDTDAVMEAAVAAVVDGVARGIPGLIGLHLEGPHLHPPRAGAHDPALLRPMGEADLDRLLAFATVLPRLIVTVAAEAVRPEQVRALTKAGVFVSLGHTNADEKAALALFKAGASLVTHLFNAMNPLESREVGLVGAALNSGKVSAGIIADGFHVDPTLIALAARGKQGPGQVFLVTDAMATVGTNATEFELQGRKVTRGPTGLRLGTGQLAGSDLTMAGGVRILVEKAQLKLAEALRMATIAPAQALHLEATIGHLRPGAVASFVHLGEDLSVKSTWIAGRPVFEA